MKVLSRKTWHEVIDDEQAYVLADYGVKYIIKQCVAESTIADAKDYETFCRKMIVKTWIPDEFSFNDLVKILDDYLRSRWEEVINGQN